MRTEQEYAELAEWAETVDPAAIKGGTVRRGKAAATHARALLEAAAGGPEQLRQAVGRPSIDPQAAPGQQSRVRHVRLAGADDQAIDDIAAAQNRTPSAIIRDAVAEYVKAHKSA
ncbi:hypothetical protein D1871_15990 [Nakamurella silvestris]|nr:hypothetical protein D1871_15990 [Nakamurella silvestris]